MTPPMSPDTPSTDDARFDLAVQIEHATVVRQGKKLLDDVTWDVAKGERWVLFGPNGSGGRNVRGPSRSSVESTGPRSRGI